MNPGTLKGAQQFGSKYVQADLQVFYFEEEGIQYAYLPSLDLTGYGNTELEAKESLKIVFEEFLRYTLARNTLLLEMKRLGWNLKNKKRPVFAATVSEMIQTNEQLKEIINSRKFSASSIGVHVPVFA